VAEDVDVGCVDGAVMGRVGAAVVRPDAVVLLERPERTMTPWQLGVEWLCGKGNTRRFTSGDAFTRLLREHRHYAWLREQLSAMAADGTLTVGASSSDPGFPFGADYDLTGLAGAVEYLRVCSAALTAGRTGNLAVAYLGSHHVALTVVGTTPDGAWQVRFAVLNQSSLSSGIRPLVIGYTEWYAKTIGGLLDRFSAATGIGRTTTQVVVWTETIRPGR